jgi:hypothetical protein
VSDYAQFAEFPDDVVFKVPLGLGEVERLVEFFTAELPDPSAAQKAWLEANARLELTVAGYMNALECGSRAAAFQSGGRAAALQLFPNVVQIAPTTIRNDGDSVIPTRTYGQPEYRLVARYPSGDRWLALPCDLHPGQTVQLDIPEPVKLFHALQGIPVVELDEVRRV